MSFFKGLTIGIVVTSIFEAFLFFIPYLKTNFWDNPKTILGYHYHHSLIGLVLLLIGISCLKKNKGKAVLLIGFGLGIILVHTLTDGRLIFIER